MKILRGPLTWSDSAGAQFVDSVWLAEHDRAIAEKAWDEGYSYCFITHPAADDVRSLKDNPYRKETRRD